MAIERNKIYPLSASVFCTESVATGTDVQTPTEIEELSLRMPRPVAIYLCESEATATRFFLCESEATATTTHD
ncbi:hypothetical protein ACIQXF_01190 [Lysinibacillus sp. NPDC097231]|uniref:hypothetical protein n=1 Tax=Lysinibacillus sp. NPDC097231 TaxID=3364142 RepID=UPI0038103D4E